MNIHYQCRSGIWFISVLPLLLWPMNATSVTSPTFLSMDLMRGSGAIGINTEYIPSVAVMMVLAFGAIYLVLIIQALLSW
jgi:hypothetical protein